MAGNGGTALAEAELCGASREAYRRPLEAFRNRDAKKPIVNAPTATAPGFSRPRFSASARSESASLRCR